MNRRLIFNIIVLLAMVGTDGLTQVPPETGTTNSVDNAASTVAAPTCRVAVAVCRGGKLDQSLTDLVTASLSDEPGIDILERNEMDRILSEWQYTDMAGSAAHGVELGRVAGIDYFVRYDMDAESAEGILEIVEAATGRSALIKKISTTTESLLDEIVLTVSLMGKELTGSDTDAANGLVLIQPNVIPATSNNITTTKRLMTDLAHALIQNRTLLLHRRYTVDLVTEQWWSEKGVLAAAAHRAPLKGAGFLLTGKLSFEKTPPHLELTLIDAATGSMKAVCDFTLSEQDSTLILPDSMVDWVVKQTTEHGNAPPLDAPAASTGDRLQPETQTAFYQGVLLYNNGKYLDAIDFFSLAHVREPTFAQSVNWIRECFEAAGLEGVVLQLDAYDKHVRSRRVLNVPLYHNNWKHLISVPGVNFLGMTYSDPELQSSGKKLLRCLFAQLKQYGPVFLSEYLTTLALEYDTFVGLENVAGANWRTTPPLLFENMLSARLCRENRDLTFELTHVRELNPISSRRVTVQLGSDHNEWDAMIGRAVSSIFATPGGDTHTYEKLPLKIEESIEDLKTELSRQYKDSTYLKLLIKDPSNFILDPRFPVHRPGRNTFESSGWGFYAAKGLQAFQLRHEKEDVKPWNELAIVLTGPNTTGDHFEDSERVRRVAISELIVRMRDIACRYPSHPAGLAARYNTLLLDTRPENYRRSLEELTDILNQVETKYKANYTGYALTAMRSTLAALSLELGEPVDPLPGGYNFCGILRAMSPGRFDDNPDTWCLFPTPSRQMHQWVPLDFNEVLQAAPVFLYLLPEMLNDPAIWRVSVKQARFILNLAPNLNLARDIVANAIKVCMNGAMNDDEHDDFTVLCENYARILVDYFSELRPRPGSFRPSLWIGPFLGIFPEYSRGITLRRMYWLSESSQERLRRAADEIEAVVVNAAAGTHKNNGDLTNYLQRAGIIMPEEPTEQELLKRMEDEWARVHLNKQCYSERHWFEYMQWKKPRVSRSEWMRICQDAYQRLRKTRIKQTGIDQKMSMYAYLGLNFFHAGEDDLADQIHSEIISWKDKLTMHERDLRPHAHYMLVLTAHRRGDVPTAFHLAQQGLEFLKDNQCSGGIWVTFGFAEGSITHNAEEELENFIIEARANPNIPYNDPFRSYTENRPDPAAIHFKPMNETPLPQDTQPVPGQDWQIPGLDAPVVWLDNGTFIMGADTDDKPDRSASRVIISRGFWIGRYEVRRQDWFAIVDHNPNDITDKPELPMENITWLDAMEFCRELTRRENQVGRLPDGYVYRLPTEAEWEYAARAGSNTSWPAGVSKQNIGEYAWHAGNSRKRIHAVGTKRPNAWGIFDMAGNVSEWCFDRYGPHTAGEFTDPYDPKSGLSSGSYFRSERVIRGARAELHATSQNLIFRRGGDFLTTTYPGFRLVLAPAIDFTTCGKQNINE